MGQVEAARLIGPIALFNVHAPAVLGQAGAPGGLIGDHRQALGRLRGSSGMVFASYRDNARNITQAVSASLPIGTLKLFLPSLMR